MSKSRLRLVGAGAAVAAILAWWELGGSEPDDIVTPPPTAKAAVAAGRVRIQAARAEVRAKQPERKVIMPANPPPLGLPAWSTRLPNQPDTGVPTPRAAP